MKICEQKEFPGGMGGGHLETRVYEADKMPDDEPGVTRFRAASKTEPFDFRADPPAVAPYAAADEETASAVNAGAPAG